MKISIEDNAQAPLLLKNWEICWDNSYIGVFSLNYPNIYIPEKAGCVTQDEELATRLRMIRNHAEAVVDRQRFTT